MLRGGIPISFLFAGILGTAVSAYGQQTGMDEFKNNLAPNVGSPEQAIDRMLEIAKLKPGETLYDLGCGDGRILIAAAKQYKVKAVGIEISSRLARIAAANVEGEGLSKRVKVIHGDFMRAELSEANVVTLYLATTANDTLRPNLEHYLKPNTRVVSYDYPVAGWKPIDTAVSEGHHGATHMIYLYEVPDSIKK
jgi:SAM-dependent methyltransferase